MMNSSIQSKSKALSLSLINNGNEHQPTVKFQACLEIISDTNHLLWIKLSTKDDDNWFSSISENTSIIELENDLEEGFKIYDHPHRINITWIGPNDGPTDEINCCKELSINWNENESFTCRFICPGRLLKTCEDKLCHVSLQDTLRGVGIFSCNLYLVNNIAMLVLLSFTSKMLHTVAK